MNAAAISYITDLRRDPHPYPDYRACHTIRDVAEYVNNSNNKSFSWPVVAIDTESLPDGSPYCLTFSHTPGTGRLIYTHSAAFPNPAFDFFRSWIEDGRPSLIAFHNYLHDAPELDHLRLPTHNFTDTMVLAYNRCLGGGSDDEDEGDAMVARGSLSLKPLAYRHLNIQMQSFQDTVFPYSLPKLSAYLEELESYIRPFSPPKDTCICTHPRSLHQEKGKSRRNTGPCSACDVCPKYSPWKKPKETDEDRSLRFLHQKVCTVIDKCNSQSTDNLWTLIDGWHPTDHTVMTDLCGPIPRPSIADVSEPELLSYACRDADATLRLYLFLMQMKPWLFYL